MQLSVTMLQHVLTMHDALDSTTVHGGRRIQMEKRRSQRTTGLQRPMSEQAESKSGRKARQTLSLEACKTSKSTFLLIVLTAAPSLQGRGIMASGRGYEEAVVQQQRQSLAM